MATRGWFGGKAGVAAAGTGALVLAALLIAPTSALAGAATVERIRAVSGKTPFADGCGVPGQPTASSEAEPYIAVDPKRPRRIVITWQQDRFAVDGGALSNLVAVSRDGGRHWKRVEVPGASICTGGEDERTSDPWVTIGPDGITYLGILTFTQYPALTGLAGPTQQRAARSVDGGRTFSPPVTIVADGTYNDRESLTADPTRPGHAYFGWVKRYGPLGESGLNLFSRTTDGGLTWSSPRVIDIPSPGTLPDPILIEVLPDGTLLDFFLLANGTPFLPEGTPIIPWDVMVMRSTDVGETWSAPVKIGSIENPFPPEDPTSGAEVRAYPVIDSAIAPDGRAYVVWNEIFSEEDSAIFVSRSTDGGLTWSEPATVTRRPTQAFIPGVAVAGDGTVGVLWDDFKGDNPNDQRLTTSVRFGYSDDGGLTWKRIRVAGPFDMLTAPETASTEIAGRFVGDYQGLAARRDRFVAAFAHAKPLRRRAGLRIRGPSDILFAQIRTGGRR